MTNSVVRIHRVWSRGLITAVAAAAVLILIGCATAEWERAESFEEDYDLQAAPLTAGEEAVEAARADAELMKEAEPSTEDQGGVFPASDVQAPDRITTRPIFRPRAPELLARMAPPDLEPLPMAAQDVSVVIADHRARVVMDLVFYNPSSEVLSATLMVGLPDRASPCYLGMFLGTAGRGGQSGQATADPRDLPGLLNPDPPGPNALLAPRIDAPSGWQAGEAVLDWGELRSAEVVEPVKGRQVYEAVTRRQVDPALAEWAGSGRFSARIYPLPPQSYKRIVFAYDQTLVPADGQIIFPLPSLAADIRDSRMTVYDVSMGIGQRTLQYGSKELAATRSLSGYAWTIQPPIPGAAATAEGLYRSALRNPVVSTLVGRDADIPGALVSLQVSPELPPQPAKETTGRALFLLDTSYSTRDLYRDLSGQLLRHILETDDSLDEFAVLCFDVKPTLLTPGFVPNSAESREHYLALIQQIWLEGATNFAGVLEYLEGQTGLKGADTCFLLSDGQITWGRENPSELSSRFPSFSNMRWICYAFGTAPYNRSLFDALTRKGGRIVHASAGQDLVQTAKAHRFPTYQLQGVFTMLQDEVIIAGDPQLLYPGQVLDIAVRIRQNTPSLRLVLTIDGKNHEIGIPLQESAAASYLAARTWAEVYVGRLMNGPAGPPDDTTVQAIFALSKHYALANDYASFIILETDEEYEQYAVFRRKLDFRAVQELVRQSDAAAEGMTRLASGTEIPVDLAPESVGLIMVFDKLKALPAWHSPSPFPMTWEPQVLLQKSQAEHPEETTTALYLLAEELFGEASALYQAPVPEKEDPGVAMATAFRVLSSIAELSPRDDQALRLLGYVLMEWGLYGEAESVFAAVKRRRPFEPQNTLLEGMAQAAQGKLGEAALRFETVLQRPFPRFGEFVKPAAARLYVDLIRAAALEYPSHPASDLWRMKAEDLLGSEWDRVPRGRLLLFWNLDDTDVDLHVRENRSTEVWYQNQTSRSGGRLFWDNTVGLGPELYEHPKLARSGFLVSVDYFSSSSVEGAAPAATFVCAVTSEGERAPPTASWHTTVLLSVEEGTVQIMPLWKR